MSDAYNPGNQAPSAPTGAPQDAVNALQNIARQIGVYAQSIANSNPAATTTASPRALGFNNIGTAATTVLSTSAIRHGLIFHNPGTASGIYVFPTGISTTPTTAALGGALLIAAGSSFPLAPTVFPNLNNGWLAFAQTGSNQPLTIIEFF